MSSLLSIENKTNSPDDLIRLPANLDNLPSDVVLLIFKRLYDDTNSLRALDFTCRRFRQIIKKHIPLQQLLLHQAADQIEAKINRDYTTVFSEIGGYKPEITYRRDEIQELSDEGLPLFIRNVVDSRTSLRNTRFKNICIPVSTFTCCVVAVTLIALSVWGIIYLHKTAKR